MESMTLGVTALGDRANRAEKSAESDAPGALDSDR
jgi:hypothetical protein